jgi:DNA-nicking Smr family endonuclease
MESLTSCCPRARLRVRLLSPEEAALWARVTSTIRPLSRDKNSHEQIEPAGEIVEPRKAPVKPQTTRAMPQERRGPGTTLDGSWDRRLREGEAEPDRVVDLHGMSLDGAWRAIDRTLEQAIARGDRLVLLITGHHRPGEPPIRRGAIRAAVHDWLEASRHASHIAAVRGAHRRHGGGGSLYIVLRRKSRLR